MPFVTVRGRRFLRPAAKAWPNFSHQRRTVS
jgi:hypothetical protein